MPKIGSVVEVLAADYEEKDTVVVPGAVAAAEKSPWTVHFVETKGRVDAGDEYYIDFESNVAVKVLWACFEPEDQNPKRMLYLA